MLKTKTKATNKLDWTEQFREHIFNRSKALLHRSTPVLAIADFAKPFYMRMDASEHAVGGILFQKEVDGEHEIERPIAFAGTKYKAAERNYPIREKELLAIMFGLKIWRVYLQDSRL